MANPVSRRWFGWTYDRSCATCERHEIPATAMCETCRHGNYAWPGFPYWQEIRELLEMRVCANEAEAKCDALKAELKQTRETLEEDAWDALRQGCLLEDGRIDHMCLSTYERLCDYFERRGWLKTAQGRIYEIVRPGPGEVSK